VLERFDNTGLRNEQKCVYPLTIDMAQYLNPVLADSDGEVDESEEREFDDDSTEPMPYKLTGVIANKPAGGSAQAAKFLQKGAQY